ncbi:serine/threonine-protein kinase STY8-like [Rutidosis leptorrhynchoides]|uniref:serine/threonine-protein kinase STY8-like n=1 Tax=Rutidosis leptorrhynchoides TaxID=125765 RepID=UPI003A99978C
MVLMLDHDNKVDVSHYGIVLWELLIGTTPYSDISDDKEIEGVIKNTLRPSIPNDCPSKWKLLMENCWSADPVERPLFTEIAWELREMLVSETRPTD